LKIHESLSMQTVFHIFLLAGFLSYKNLPGTEISIPLLQ
jgi:hypothetical protein